MMPDNLPDDSLRLARDPVLGTQLTRAMADEIDRLRTRVAELERECGRAESERKALGAAWLQVCHEGNVPQYEDVSVADPMGIVHGIRQLACAWGTERVLRQKREAERDEALAAVKALSLENSDMKDTLDVLGSAYGSEIERADEALAQVAAMREVLIDALSGWRYIRQVHGDLSGVGWDRVEIALHNCLASTARAAEAFVERIRREECEACAQVIEARAMLGLTWVLTTGSAAAVADAVRARNALRAGGEVES